MREGEQQDAVKRSSANDRGLVFCGDGVQKSFAYRFGQKPEVIYAWAKEIRLGISPRCSCKERAEVVSQSLVGCQS